MKKKIIVLLIAFLVVSVASFAQEDKVSKLDQMPGINDKLKAKITAIKDESKENAAKYAENKKKLKKELEKLMRAYPADLDAIDAKIKAIKKEDAAEEYVDAQKHQKIRKLLTDEQRTYYDDAIMLDKKKKK